MLATSLDVLYVSLAIGFFLVAVFLSVALIYVILILRDVSKASEKTRDAVEQVHEYVMKPIFFARAVKKFVDPVLQKMFAEEESKKK